MRRFEPPAPMARRPRPPRDSTSSPTLRPAPGRMHHRELLLVVLSQILRHRVRHVLRRTREARRAELAPQFKNQKVSWVSVWLKWSPQALAFVSSYQGSILGTYSGHTVESESAGETPLLGPTCFCRGKPRKTAKCSLRIHEGMNQPRKN